MYRLPPSPGQGDRRLHLSFSVLAQINSLLYSCLGVVLERDVLAGESDCSYNKYRGWGDRESLSSFVGLYWAPPSLLPGAVAALMSHLACGLVVLPAPELCCKSVIAPRNGVEKPWLEVLDEPCFLRLRFGLPRGQRAVFVSFNSTWKMKAKRRPEKFFQVERVPQLESAGPHLLGVLPVSPSRSSPDMASFAPSAEMDSESCCGKQTEEPDLVMPSPPGRWIRGVVESWSATFPDRVVAKMARQAVGDGLDPGFVGEIRKSVIRPNPASIKGHEEDVRTELLEEVSAGRIAGPFTRPPFQFFRNCPLRMIKKDPHVPESTRMRLISNFSAGRFSGDGWASVNDLCVSPKLLGFHLRPHHIRDVIASKGKGCTVWASDIPKCFRRQRNIPRLLSLFVYLLDNPERGREYFVDLCNPFGWAPSEYGWQCILAVLMWRLRLDGVRELLAYVDNFFRIFGPDEKPSGEVKKIMRRLDEAGIELHEIQEGASFKGLGWWWHLDSMEMKCTEDKKKVFAELLSQWAARSPIVMSLAEVRTAVGFMVWLSAGFHVGAAGVAALVALRSKLECVARRKDLSAEAVEGKLSPEQKETVLFWAKRFPEWSGVCPIVLGFSPVSTWERLGQQDASTEWGCGGVMFDGVKLVGYAREWSASERKLAFVDLRESTGVFELMGALEWFRHFGGSCKGKRLQLEMDNESAVLALNRLFSPRPAMLDLVRSVRDEMFLLSACVRVVRVLGRFISVADRLSHNRIEDAKCIALREFGVPLVMVSRPPTS